MSLIETIQNRHSVRTYTGEPLKKEDAEAIRKYIAGLEQPLGGKARVELVGRQTEDGPVRLGTYGVISGARDFLVLIYENGPLAEENAGYLFEQVILFCTGLGLGTCWLGGTLRQSDFAKHTRLKENEILRIVSPVGYPAGKKRLLERVMRAGAGSDNRKPFGALFFGVGFGIPMKMEMTGAYRQPLEMLRLAPSANNSQPWQVVATEGFFHFYYQDKSRFSPIDLGIALCHFGETCRELGVAGRFEVLPPGSMPVDKGSYYGVSWIIE